MAGWYAGSISSRPSARTCAHGCGGYGVAEERLCLFPNWVDTEVIRPLAAPSPLRRQWGLADHQVVALYAGSMGEKQGLDALVEVAERLRAHPEVQLVLCGAGPGAPPARASDRNLRERHPAAAAARGLA